MFELGQTIYAVNTDHRRKTPCKVVNGQVVDIHIHKQLSRNGEVNTFTSYGFRGGDTYPEIFCFPTEQEAVERCDKKNDYHRKQKDFKL